MKKGLIALLVIFSLFFALWAPGNSSVTARNFFQEGTPEVRLEFPAPPPQNPVYFPLIFKPDSPVEVISQGCSDAIINGGFETTGGWIFPTTEYSARYSTSLSHAGARSLLTGITAAADNTYSYSTSLQLVTIPSNTTSAWLRFWLYPNTTELASKSIPARMTEGSFGQAILSSDVQYVVILNQSNQIIETLVWQRYQASGWVSYSINLTKYAGRSIQVLFGTYNDGLDGITSLYVDDVTVEICPGSTIQTPTPTATTPGQASCVEKISNGGFETDASWDLPITEYPAAYSTARAHSGTRSLRTGITNTADNRYSYSSARQQITIPSGTVSAQLSFWLSPITGETPTKAVPPQPSPGQMFFEEASMAGDIQYVLILDVFNQIQETLIWERTNSQNWTEHRFDLTKYSGKTIRLQFGTYNDGLGGITAMFVDDVSVQACSSLVGTSTPGPSPTSTNTPLPTPTRINTPVPSSTPSTCFNEMTNSGFETNQAWVIPVTAYSAGYSTSQVYSGQRSMRAGIVYPTDNRYSYSDFRQDVFIPSNTNSAWLRFSVYASSSESTAKAVPAIPINPTFGAAALASDVQYLLVLDHNGNWIDTLLWQRSNNRTWTAYQINLKKYAGRSIKLQFGVYNDGWDGITSMYVDEVVLEICTGQVVATATHTSTPGPSPTHTNTPPPPGTQTSTPVPSATPATCYNEITNSGFQTDQAWVIPITEYSAGYSTAQSYTGGRSMRAGILSSQDNQYSYSDFRQDVTIPSNVRSAWLRYWIRPSSSESANVQIPKIQLSRTFGQTAMAGDVQYLIVLDSAQNWIDTLLWVRRNTQTWEHYQINLIRYAGKTIYLQFGVYNDGYGGFTSMYVDDVVLELCRP